MPSSEKDFRDLTAALEGPRGFKRVGLARIVILIDYGGGYVDVLHKEVFEVGFAYTDGHCPGWLDEEVGDYCLDSIEEHYGGLPCGVYELVGEVWYYYDPGCSTPNGPAEPDSYWELRSVQKHRLTPKEEEIFFPMDKQAWKHQTSKEQEGIRGSQCKNCKLWHHGNCGSCEPGHPAEDSFCSEQCWIAAGRPEFLENKDEHIQS